jgi:tetratricopeptide (TPR) repeat protein
MSDQIASGTGNIQILVKESENVRVEINGTRVASLWVPPFRQPLPQALRKNRDLALLLATTGITDLVGRDDLWQDCLAWCRDSRLDPVSALCITGRGGSGKTRFALEMVHHLRNIEGWDARFVRFEESAPFDLWGNTDGSNNVLLVFDYAPDNAVAIANSLRFLAENPPKYAKRRLRILLLARTAALGSGWLLPFEAASTLEVGRSPRDLFRHPAEIIELSPMSENDRIRIFMQAYRKAATQLGIRESQIDESVFRSRHAKEVLKDPLALMMAALVGLQNGVPNALSLTRVELVYEATSLLVGQRLRTAFPENPALALHMTAFATLTAGLSMTEALEVLEVESRALHLGSAPDPSSFVSRLAAWFPGKSGEFMGAIEPDILGEAHVLNELSPRNEMATEVLFRAIKYRSKDVAQFLIRVVQDYCFAKGENNTKPLQWLRALIETGNTDDLQLMMEINAALPESTVVLRQDSLSLRERLNERVSRLAANSEQAEPMRRMWLLVMRAAFLNLLSTSQSDMGLFAEALTSAQDAAKLMGELAERDPLVYGEAHANFLNDLGNRQNEMGQSEAALSNQEKSVELQRQRVERDRGALPHLAKSVNNLGITLRKMGRYDASLLCAEEAVSLYRGLVDEDQDEFLPVLAGFLTNLSNSQSFAGQHEAALASAIESERYIRELAERNRDAFLPKLAAVLTNISVMQGRVGKHESALASSEESVKLSRELVEFKRDVFLPGLAAALNNLSGRQSSVGLKNDALLSAQEAVAITRELLVRSRDAIVSDHAMFCSRLGFVLIELDRCAEAAEALADGLRELLPLMKVHPLPPLIRQGLSLFGLYFRATSAGNIERDRELLATAMPILGPHLTELGDQSE